MSLGKTIVAALLAVAGVTLSLQSAIAEESGSFSRIGSSVYTYTALEHAGETLLQGTLEGAVTVTKSSGGPFVEGEHGLMKRLLRGKRLEAGVDVESTCSVTAAPGNSWYFLSTQRAGDAKGNTELMGGTGKYAGVTGSCTYVVDILEGNRAVTMADCTWQRP